MNVYERIAFRREGVTSATRRQHLSPAALRRLSTVALRHDQRPIPMTTPDYLFMLHERMAVRRWRVTVGDQGYIIMYKPWTAPDDPVPNR